MSEKKSILEEALLDIKKIQEALNSNTKEILRTVGREEIDKVVKESISKDYVEETINEEDDEVSTDLASDETESVDSMAGEVGAEDAVGDDLEVGDDAQVGDEIDLSGDNEIDMTTASDEDIISVYKKLSGNDEIEIVGDEIRLSVSEPGEYVIKTSELMGNETSEEDFEDESMEIDSNEFGGEEDETEYEIEMGDDESEEIEDEIGGEEEDETEEDEEETIDEVITKGVGGSVGKHSLVNKEQNKIGQPEGAGVNESVKAKLVDTVGKYNKLLSEAKKLKSENEEIKQSLSKFRKMLNETVVFNSNLTYVTKLFTEFSTTKDEKGSIISRFDNEVSTIKESKKLYNVIKSELTSKKPMVESIDNKITKDITSGSSKILTENTAYVDPSTKRILDLMKRVEKK